MSFTNGEPSLVTAEVLGFGWSGAQDGRNFRCHLCGHFFVEGDYFVFVYGGQICGNLLACASAEGPTHGTPDEMRAAAFAAAALVRERYWWALPNQQRPPRPGAKRDSRADRWDP